MKIIDGKIIDTGFELFNGHPKLRENLAYAAFNAMASAPGRHYIYDYSLNMRLNRGKVLAMALAIKDFIGREFPEEKRIGIALPSGIPGIAVNLAVQLAGKVSVNLNFTMGREAAEACLKRAAVRCVISSDKIRERVEQRTPGYPWGDNFYDIQKLLKRIGKGAIAKKYLMLRTVPAGVLRKIFGVPTEGGEREASIIFTSGSEGMPKAAVLTHRNIMANCVQMDATKIISPEDILHANLPLFHSFGQSIQLWFTCIYGNAQVAVQSPLEVHHNFEAMRKGRSTLMISTPTFLRSYWKKGNPEDAESMRTVIAGAEKTPDGFLEMWEKKFPKSKYKVGYGLTEASPVVSVNLPENLPDNGWRTYPSMTRAGSVGQLFGGMQACVINPDTHEMLPVGQSGMLCLKGASIFGGYLDMPDENAFRFMGDWLLTGDISSLDGDAFIYIKGRLSRFSKIGGEMVPHALIEEKIIRLLGQEDAEAPTCAIGARDDENKGECLVLVTTLDVDMADLRHKLSAEGVSNLWIPRVVKKVDSIPILGAGKLDIAAVQRIAKER